MRADENFVIPDSTCASYVTAVPDSFGFQFQRRRTHEKCDVVNRLPGRTSTQPCVRWSPLFFGHVLPQRCGRCCATSRFLHCDGVRFSTVADCKVKRSHLKRCDGALCLLILFDVMLWCSDIIRKCVRRVLTCLFFFSPRVGMRRFFLF